VRRDKVQIGVVVNVVTKAMITSIANSGGGMTFRSYPMFSTINSIKPRVFTTRRAPTNRAS